MARPAPELTASREGGPWAWGAADPETPPWTPPLDTWALRLAADVGIAARALWPLRVGGPAGAGSLWGALAHACGADWSRWAAWGAAFGGALGVTGAAIRWIVDPPDADSLRGDALIARATSPAMRRLLAGPLRGGDRAALRALLLGRDGRAAVDGALGPALDALPDDSALASATRALLEAQRAANARLSAWMVLVEAGLPPASPSAWGPPSIRADLADARAWLTDAAPWTDAIELRRRGFDGAPQRLVAELFGPGLVAEAMLAAGLDASEPALALLAAVPEGGLRYYAGWRGIPPDIDSLGLALRLGALLRERGRLDDATAARIDGWLEDLVDHAGDGVPGTWLTDRPGQPDAQWSPRPLPWAGPTCTACRCSLALGLLAWRASGAPGPGRRRGHGRRAGPGDHRGDALPGGVGALHAAPAGAVRG